MKSPLLALCDAHYKALKSFIKLYLPDWKQPMITSRVLKGGGSLPMADPRPRMWDMSTLWVLLYILGQTVEKPQGLSGKTSP